MPPLRTKLTHILKPRPKHTLPPTPESVASPIFATASDLWQEAFDALEPVEQADLLKVDRTGRNPGIVDSVAELAKQRYADQRVKAWKLSRGKGKSDVKLRDATTKLLASVLRYKGLVDIGVTFDPTGHASTVWSALSIGLQVSKNYMERLDAVLVASNTIADAMARYAAIEKHYFRNCSLGDTEFLGKTLVSMYTSMLKFAIGVIHQAKSNVVESILASISALTEQPLMELTRDLERKESDVRKWMELLEHQYRKEESRIINEKAISILETLEANTKILVSVEAKVLTGEEQSILTWLSNSDFSASQNLAQTRWEPGTGAWFLMSSEYAKIKAGDIRCLWLYGSSGCGKTVLCSTIIRDLEQLCRMDEANGIAYWYFSFSERGSLSLGNSLSSLLRQLCSVTNAVPTSIQNLWKKHNISGSRPSSDTLLTVLDGMLDGLARESRQVFLVLDALDECPARLDNAAESSMNEKNISLRSEVLDTLMHLIEKHSVLRIVATSRKEVDIKSRFESWPRLNIEDHVSDDLDIFVRKSLDKIVESDDWKEAYRSEIQLRLVSAEDERRFRWAYLVLLELSECLDAEQVEEALRTIPETLEKAYEQSLSRIPKRHKEKAKQLLMWLSYAFWPLTLEEAAAVLQLHQPRDVLRILPSGIITSALVKEDDCGRDVEPVEREELKFDHFSVKEYLTSRSSTDVAAGEYVIEPPLAHLTISQQCVSRILKNNAEKAIFYAVPEDPLTAYSAFLWFRHVQYVDAFDASQLVTPPFEEWQWWHSMYPPISTQLQEQMVKLRLDIHRIFQRDFTTAFRNWCRTMSRYDLVRNRDTSSCNAQTIFRAYDDLTPIDVAVMLTLPTNLHRLLDDGHIAQSHLLQFAVCQGEPSVVAILLERTRLDVDLSSAIWRITSDPSRMLETIFRLRPELIVSDELFQQASHDRYYERHLKDSWSTSLQHLLERRDNVALSEDAIRQIIEHQGDARTVKLLLQYNDNITISDTSLALAARHQNGESLGLLILHRPTGICMDELLMQAAQNLKHGEDVMGILLACIPRRIEDGAKLSGSDVQNVNGGTTADEAQGDFRLKPEVVELAAAFHGVNMLIALVQRFGDVPVTEWVMLAVVSNSFQGLAMMRFLVTVKGLDLPVSQTLIGVVEEKVPFGEEQVGMMHALLVKYRGMVEAGAESFGDHWVEDLFNDIPPSYLEPYFRGGKI